MKHTPGPWRVDPRGIGTPWNVGTDDQDIALAAAQCGDDMKQTRRSANARLIAAAPKLLRFVQMFAALRAVDDVYSGDIDEAAALLAEIKGE